jgi:hypothetical protein
MPCLKRPIIGRTGNATYVNFILTAIKFECFCLARDVFLRHENGIAY